MILRTNPAECIMTNSDNKTRKPKLPRISEEEIRSLADYPAIFERGEDYFEMGCVNEIDFKDGLLTAKVMGSIGNYIVKVFWAEDNPIRMFCNCPFDGIICKHIIAVLLSLNKKMPDVIEGIVEKDNEEKKLEKLLSGLSKPQLLKMIAATARDIPDALAQILKLADKMGIGGEKKIKELAVERADDYLEQIEEIVSEFNEYGGGPDDKEYHCYELMEDLENLLNEKPVPSREREEIISFCSKYIQAGNSGFDDSLLELAFTAASDEKHWKLLIRGLESLVEPEGYSYYRNIILNIYREQLGDEETYLKGRNKALYFGRDYLDLAQYWRDKGDLPRAIEIAESGLKKGHGRLTGVRKFLMSAYKGKRGEGRSFEMMIQLWEESPTLRGYKEIKKRSLGSEWANIEERLLKTVYTDGTRNSQLIEIRLLRNDYESVLRYFQKRVKSWYSRSRDYPNYEWAKILFEFYPDEIIECYRELVNRSIDGKKRKSYQTGADFARKLKKFWKTRPKGNREWKDFISNIRKKYPRSPALLNEFSSL